MQEHVICRNNAAPGPSYAIKVSSEIYEKFGNDFLKHHFDFAISMAITDLIHDGKGEFIEINRTMAQLKAKQLPGYSETIESLLESTMSGEDKELLQKQQRERRRKMRIINTTDTKIDNQMIRTLASEEDTELLTVYIQYPKNEEEKEMCGQFIIANPLPEIFIYLREDFPISRHLVNGQEITIRNTRQYIAEVFLRALYHYTVCQGDILLEFRSDKNLKEDKENADTYVYKKLKKYADKKGDRCEDN